MESGTADQVRELQNQVDILELENRALRFQNAKQLELVAQKEQALLEQSRELADLRKLKAKIVERAKALIGPNVQL